MKKKQHKPEGPSVLPGMQVEFICPKCGKSLAWALPDTEMKCPSCGYWVTGKNRKKTENDLMLPLDDDQLILF